MASVDGDRDFLDEMLSDAFLKELELNLSRRGPTPPPPPPEPMHEDAVRFLAARDAAGTRDLTGVTEYRVAVHGTALPIDRIQSLLDISVLYHGHDRIRIVAVRGAKTERAYTMPCIRIDQVDTFYHRETYDWEQTLDNIVLFYEVSDERAFMAKARDKARWRKLRGEHAPPITPADAYYDVLEPRFLALPTEDDPKPVPIRIAMRMFDCITRVVREFHAALDKRKRPHPWMYSPPFTSDPFTGNPEVDAKMVEHAKSATQRQPMPTFPFRVHGPDEENAPFKIEMHRDSAYAETATVNDLNACARLYGLRESPGIQFAADRVTAKVNIHDTRYEDLDSFLARGLPLIGRDPRLGKRATVVLVSAAPWQAERAFRSVLLAGWQNTGLAVVDPETHEIVWNVEGTWPHVLVSTHTSFTSQVDHMRSMQPVINFIAASPILDPAMDRVAKKGFGDLAGLIGEFYGTVPSDKYRRPRKKRDEQTGGSIQYGNDE